MSPCKAHSAEGIAFYAMLYAPCAVLFVPQYPHRISRRRENYSLVPQRLHRIRERGFN
ncbi:MAG: hypothetical protein ACREOO_26755 [bacterium]